MAASITRRDFVRGASIGSAFITSPLGLLTEGELGSGVPIAEHGEGAAEVASPLRKPKVLVFDVNQTLLDLNELRPQFARLFGDGRALDEWFSLLLQYSLVVTVTDSYTDFGSVARAVLQMMAKTKGVSVSGDGESRVIQGLLSLPPHPDVPENLKRLRAAGFRMVTLTNSSPGAVKAQLQNSGLAQYFDESISVESVRRFKPDLMVYRSAAAHLGEKPEDLLLIAAHAWDVFGALKAGWQAALLTRSGVAPFPLSPVPQLSGLDLSVVSNAMLS